MEYARNLTYLPSNHVQYGKDDFWVLFHDLQVAQPVRALVELRRVCLVRESSAKRWVPLATGAPLGGLDDEGAAEEELDKARSDQHNSIM